MVPKLVRKPMLGILSRIIEIILLFERNRHSNPCMDNPIKNKE